MADDLESISLERWRWAEPYREVRYERITVPELDGVWYTEFEIVSGFQSYSLIFDGDNLVYRYSYAFSGLTDDVETGRVSLIGTWLHDPDEHFVHFVVDSTSTLGGDPQSDRELSEMYPKGQEIRMAYAPSGLTDRGDLLWSLHEQVYKDGEWIDNPEKPYGSYRFLLQR